MEPFLLFHNDGSKLEHVSSLATTEWGCGDLYGSARWSLYHDRGRRGDQV